MNWYNEPPHWQRDGDRIVVTAGPKTDFWRKTHYGFIRDNGHLYGQTVGGDFVAEVKVSGQYRTLYDQAGLMVRLDETTWMKCGIEYVGGVQHVSVVVTRDFSDWSVIPLPHNPPSIWLRVTRRGDSLEIHYSLDSKAYHMVRLAHFPPQEVVTVGLMCAAPEGEGFPVVFEGFAVRREA
jgi:regulation of enolase protein 1 (concanavalin A-like superfamily)